MGQFDANHLVRGVSQFLTRPEANAFFKKSSAMVNSEFGQEVGNQLSSPNQRSHFSYLRTLHKCITLRGRTSIAEFWIFYLINLAICLIPFVCFITWYSYVLSSRGQDSPDFGPLPFLFFLPILVLTPSIAIRRLHDSGKSGWWLLLGFLPGAGGVILLVFLLLPGETRENRYGAVPS